MTDKKKLRDSRITLDRLAEMVARGFQATNERLDGNNERLDAIDERLAALEKGMEIVDSDLESLALQIGNLRSALYEDVSSRLRRVEEKVFGKTV